VFLISVLTTGVASGIIVRRQAAASTMAAARIIFFMIIDLKYQANKNNPASSFLKDTAGIPGIIIYALILWADGRPTVRTAWDSMIVYADYPVQENTAKPRLSGKQTPPHISSRFLSTVLFPYLFWAGMLAVLPG
jgi:hypothetical protein